MAASNVQKVYFWQAAYIWHISVAELLHAKVLLVVVNGSTQVPHSVHGMQKTPLVLLGPLLDVFTGCHNPGRARSAGPGACAQC